MTRRQGDGETGRQGEEVHFLYQLLQFKPEIHCLAFTGNDKIYDASFMQTQQTVNIAEAEQES